LSAASAIRASATSSRSRTPSTSGPPRYTLAPSRSSADAPDRALGRTPGADVRARPLRPAAVAQTRCTPQRALCDLCLLSHRIGRSTSSPRGRSGWIPRPCGSNSAASTISSVLPASVKLLGSQVVAVAQLAAQS
jgi:hypothetical protein